MRRGLLVEKLENLAQISSKLKAHFISCTSGFLHLSITNESYLANAVLPESWVTGKNNYIIQLFGRLLSNI